MRTVLTSLVVVVVVVAVVGCSDAATSVDAGDTLLADTSGDSFSDGYLAPDEGIGPLTDTLMDAVSDAQLVPDEGVGPMIDTVVETDTPSLADASVDSSPPPVPPYDLVVVGSGYGSLDGALIQALLIDTAALETVGKGEGVVELGEFEVVMPDLLAPDKSYAVVVLVDEDADGLCSYAWSSDLGGEVTLPEVVGDTTVSLDHADASEPDETFCKLFPHQGPHDLKVLGEGFGSHQGKALYLAVGQLPDWSAPLATEAIVVPSSGSVMYKWPDLLEDPQASYELIAYLDTDDDEACADTEPQWSVTLPPRTDDVTVELTYPSSGTTGTCARFEGPYALIVTISGVDTSLDLLEAVVHLKSGFSTDMEWLYLYESTTTTTLDGFLDAGTYYEYCICLRQSGGPCGYSPVTPSWNGTIGFPTTDVHVTHSVSNGTLDGCP